MPATIPYIPEYITVHLGDPQSNAPNVTVPFPEYIKNVASSEIYPTWPENALRANIYAIITFALNRIYLEWYRNRGYDFDITNSTQYDQAYREGHEIFGNINSIVDDIFNNYITKGNSIAPYYTAFCNGTTVQCNGLSQWGSVELAQQGYTPYQILQYYYGNNIQIVQNAPIRPYVQSYPGHPLRLGDSSNEVRLLQIQLNRIGDNYPAIPEIVPTNGTFGLSTQEAVKEFQRIFNLTVDGIVGKQTWYQIKYIYNSVKRLGELTAESLTEEEIANIFPLVLQQGNQGLPVQTLQYYLRLVSYIYPQIPMVEVDGYFGPKTEEAVRAFQRQAGVTEDGIVGVNTWEALLNVYQDIRGQLSAAPNQNRASVYPGRVLLLGSRGDDVRNLQTYLNTIADVYPGIPKVEVDGIFGPATEEAVIAFQQRYGGLDPTGTVNAVTWDRIAVFYDDVVRNKTA